MIDAVTVTAVTMDRVSASSMRSMKGRLLLMHAMYVCVHRLLDAGQTAGSIWNAGTRRSGHISATQDCRNYLRLASPDGTYDDYDYGYMVTHSNSWQVVA